MDTISLKQERLILGTDRRDAERQIDQWLSQNPEIKIIRIHEMKREPLSWLTLIGGRSVPRVSVTVEYQYDEAAAPTDAILSPTVAPAENNDCEKDADGGRDQSAHENLFAAQTHRNVKEMAQQRSGQHRGEDNAE